MENLAKEREMYLKGKKKSKEQLENERHNKFKAYMLNNLDKIVDDRMKKLLLEDGNVVITIPDDDTNYNYLTGEHITTHENIEEHVVITKPIPNMQDFVWSDGIQAQYNDLLITTYRHENFREIHLTVAPHDVDYLIKRYFTYVKNGGKNSFLLETKSDNTFAGTCSLLACLSGIPLGAFIITLGKNGPLALGWGVTYLLITSFSFLYRHFAKQEKDIVSQISKELDREIGNLNINKEVEDWG